MTDDNLQQPNGTKISLSFGNIVSIAFRSVRRKKAILLTQDVLCEIACNDNEQWIVQKSPIGRFRKHIKLVLAEDPDPRMDLRASRFNMLKNQLLKSHWLWRYGYESESAIAKLDMGPPHTAGEWSIFSVWTDKRNVKGDRSMSLLINACDH
uniref:Uncharacterized protein n=1 Tax=Romanomermis culicivorax TaxID=13658 RepID=A0A915JV77_ROMCU